MTTFSTPLIFSTAISSGFAPIFSNNALTDFRRSPFLHGTESNSDLISSGVESRTAGASSLTCVKALEQKTKTKQNRSDSFDFIANYPFRLLDNRATKGEYRREHGSRFDHRLNQFDLLYRRLPVRAALDFFHLLQRIETVNDFSEDRIFAVEVRGRGEHDEERRERGVGVVGSRHRENAADVFARRAEFAFERANPFVGVMRLIARAPLAEPSLNDEAGHHAMKERVIVPARLRQLQKIAHVFRRQIWLERDGEVAEGRMQDDFLAHLVDAGGLERFLAFRFDLDADDFDRRVELLVGVGFGHRDFINDLDAFGDLSEDRELAVELGLSRRADEELSATAVGLAGDANRRDRAGQVFDVAEFIGQLVESAAAPPGARRLRVFEQRVATLNDAQTNRAMERRAVIKTRPGVLDERLNMFRGLCGKELETDHAEVGGDHRFEGRRLFERDRRRLGAGRRRVLLARRLSKGRCGERKKEE